MLCRCRAVQRGPPFCGINKIRCDYVFFRIKMWDSLRFFVSLHTQSTMHYFFRTMADEKKIKTALVSVFHKDGLDELLKKLNDERVKFLSTGGTQSFIESLGYECQKVEDVTTYPSILGGRVKTLHPKIFGGILARRDNEGDQ